MKRTKRKPGYLGPAFYEWLTFLEIAESAVYGSKLKLTKKPLAIGINEEAFGITDSDAAEVEMIMVSAGLARSVRSSVKYRMSIQTIKQIHEEFPDEIEYIKNTRPLRLPHEACTIVFDAPDLAGDSYVVCVQEEYPRDDYPELECAHDEPFICANIVGYRPSGLAAIGPHSPHVQGSLRLSHFPVEIHMQNGVLVKDNRTLWAAADGVATDHPIAEYNLKIIYGMIMTWWTSLQLASVLRSKTAGVPPSPADFVPRKNRKKRQFPRFEHFVVELPVDEFPADAQGRTCIQPKKRLHQVRGFWRHYKSGKTVWVKPHWRGDEKLGVVKNDYELTLNRNSS